MSLRRSHVENIALTMLERHGIAVMWELHLIAAKAYREGSKASAAAIIEIADAAEREWMRGNGRRLTGRTARSDRRSDQSAAERWTGNAGLASWPRQGAFPSPWMMYRRA